MSFGFAFNESIGSGDANFDYYVVKGYRQNVPGLADREYLLCEQSDPGQFGFCEIELSGHLREKPISVIVESKTGTGQFQILVSWWTYGR